MTCLWCVNCDQRPVPLVILGGNADILLRRTTGRAVAALGREKDMHAYENMAVQCQRISEYSWREVDHGDLSADLSAAALYLLFSRLNGGPHPTGKDQPDRISLQQISHW